MKYSRLSKKILAWSLPVVCVFAGSGCTWWPAKSDEPANKQAEVNDELNVTENDGAIVRYDPDKENQSAETETTVSEDDIVLGPVKNDTEQLKSDQTAVDEGKELWRQDPEQVLLAYKEDYGFYPKDKYALAQQTPAQPGQPAQAVFAVQHGQKSYVVVLQPAFPDQEKSIWVWTSVSENKPQ